MDSTLRARLNPYSNGMLTQNLFVHVTDVKHECLNPYSNGMLTQWKRQKKLQQKCCLNPYSNGMLTQAKTGQQEEEPTDVS